MSTKDDLLELFRRYNKLSLNTIYEIMPNNHKSIRKRLCDLRNDGYIEYADGLEGSYCLSNKLDVDKIKAENQLLKEQIAFLSKRDSVTNYNFDGSTVRFGVISDTHLGSIKENLALLKSAYTIFEREGIDKVYHAGDISDGENVYKGHIHEIKIHGFDAQLDYIINEYPVSNVTTVFITGNHDESFWKSSGADIGKYISTYRPDMKYIGMVEADINLCSLSGNIKLRLWHPSLGTAYAISYQAQKYIESLSGGSKPHILIVGNFHKAMWLFYRNIHSIEGACMQFQTRWMRSKRISAMLGFYIVTATIDENGVVNITPKFYPDYDS